MRQLCRFILLLASLALADQDLAFRVNQIAFPLSDFDKQFMATLEQYKKDFLLPNDSSLTLPELEQLKYGVLDTLIDRAVLMDYSKQKHIVISDKTIKARLAELKKRYPSADAFEKAIKQYGINPSQIMESLRLQLTQEALIDRTFKDSFAVTSQDVLLYIRQKNITVFPLFYDLTLAVTDNKRWLESIKAEDFIAPKWPHLRLNLDYSTLNMTIADTDLDFAMQSFLDTLELNVMSSTCPFDDANYYRVRINQIRFHVPASFREMIQGIKDAIRNEKRSKRLATWLKEQRQKTFIKVNVRAFPDFYHREPVL